MGGRGRGRVGERMGGDMLLSGDGGRTYRCGQEHALHLPAQLCGEDEQAAMFC